MLDIANRMKFVVIFLLLFICKANGVCPVEKIMPVNSIEEEIVKQFSSVKDFIYSGQTITGFMISIKKELIFDECDCISDSGKVLLDKLAQIMKTSGRRWEIYCHTTEGKDLLEKLSKTSIQAGEVTEYLTTKERCLINQLFPIGFGSIMPTKNKTNANYELKNRVDFIIEEYNLNLSQ